MHGHNDVTEDVLSAVLNAKKAVDSVKERLENSSLETLKVMSSALLNINSQLEILTDLKQGQDERGRGKEKENIQEEVRENAVKELNQSVQTIQTLLSETEETSFHDDSHQEEIEQTKAEILALSSEINSQVLIMQPPREANLTGEEPTMMTTGEGTFIPGTEEFNQERMSLNHALNDNPELTPLFNPFLERAEGSISETFARGQTLTKEDEDESPDTSFLTASSLTDEKATNGTSSISSIEADFDAILADVLSFPKKKNEDAKTNTEDEETTSESDEFTLDDEDEEAATEEDDSTLDAPSFNNEEEQATIETNDESGGESAEEEKEEIQEEEEAAEIDLEEDNEEVADKKLKYKFKEIDEALKAFQILIRTDAEHVKKAKSHAYARRDLVTIADDLIRMKSVLLSYQEDLEKKLKKLSEAGEVRRFLTRSKAKENALHNKLSIIKKGLHDIEIIGKEHRDLLRYDAGQKEITYYGKHAEYMADLPAAKIELLKHLSGQNNPHAPLPPSIGGITMSTDAIHTLEKQEQPSIHIIELKSAAAGSEKAMLGTIQHIDPATKTLSSDIYCLDMDALKAACKNSLFKRNAINDTALQVAISLFENLLADPSASKTKPTKVYLDLYRFPPEMVKHAFMYAELKGYIAIPEVGTTKPKYSRSDMKKLEERLVAHDNNTAPLLPHRTLGLGQSSLAQLRAKTSPREIEGETRKDTGPKNR